MTRRATTPRAGAREDDGFTLIELLVTMSIATIVLIAILGAADVFSTTTNAATRVSVAQDTGRATLRQMTDTLRQARQPVGEPTPIDHTETSSHNDLIAASYVPDASGALQPGWVRYCATADGKSLLMARRIVDAYPGAPGACAIPATNPDPSSGWQYGTLISGDLTDSRVFHFSSDTCFGATGTCPPSPQDVRSVGISLAVGDGTSANPDRAALLTGAVSLRNRSNSSTPPDPTP